MLASWLLLLGGIEIVLGGLMTAYPTLLPQWAGLVIVGIGVLTIVAAVTNIGRDVWQWVLGKAHAQYQALHPGPATTAVRKPWVEFREEIIAATCPDADRWTALLQSFQQAALDGEVRLYGRNDPSYATGGTFRRRLSRSRLIISKSGLCLY
jgi:hypothetical protein